MPDGVEAQLRTAWKTKHAFNMMGVGLDNEDIMTKIYDGLQAMSGTTPAPSLYVPDVNALVRRPNLSQKSLNGHILTEDGLDSVDLTLDPCTNHPEFWLHLRA